MERGRSSSASSTDSWSLLEPTNRSRLSSSSASSCYSDSGDSDVLDEDIRLSDEELELAEEAYDSEDSDVEVREMEEDEESTDDERELAMEHELEPEVDEEEEAQLEEENEEAEGKEKEEEGIEESDDEDVEEEDAKMWCEVDHSDTSDPDALQYMPPHQIKHELDNLCGVLQSRRHHLVLLLLSFTLLLYTCGIVSMMYIQVAYPRAPKSAMVEEPSDLQYRVDFETVVGRLGHRNAWEKPQKSWSRSYYPSLNASMLDEMRLLRRTRRVLNINDGTSLVPSLLSTLHPTIVQSMEPEMENSTKICPCSTRPSFARNIRPSYPEIAAFSSNYTEGSVPCFEDRIKPVASCRNTAFKRHHFFATTEAFGFVRKPLGSVFVSKTSSPKKVMTTPRRVATAPLPPPSSIRHLPSRHYFSKGIKKTHSFQKPIPPPRVKGLSKMFSTNSHRFQHKRSEQKSLQLCNQSRALAMRSQPKTWLPKRSRRALSQALYSSNYWAVAKIAESMTSRASVLMRRNARKAPKQCDREDWKTSKYVKRAVSSHKRSRLSYKQPLPCRANYLVDRTVSHRKSFELSGKVFNSSQSEQRFYKKLRVSSRKVGGAMKKLAGKPKFQTEPRKFKMDWMSKRSLHRAANRKY